MWREGLAWSALSVDYQRILKTPTSNHTGTFRLDMDKRLDPAPLTVPRARTPSDASAPVWAKAAGGGFGSPYPAGVTVEVSCRRGTGW